MGIREEIVPYIDGNGLVAPSLCSSTGKGSDNGVMYTAEYYVMLKKLNQLIPEDVIAYTKKIEACIDSEGMLCRVPIGQDDGQEQVDDYYGTANGCKQLKITSIPRTILKSIVKNFGFMDNENPGMLWIWDSFMPRQLQLMAALITAAFPGWKNPFHILIRALCWPLYFYSAIVIAISCIGTDPNSADPRRLAWHLVQTVSSVSLMCKLASIIWYKRLYSVYGASGMQSVAQIYYKDNHPFCRYWITK